MPTSLWLYSGEANPNNIKLTDPTVQRSTGGGAYTLTAAAGSFTLSGQAATLTRARVLVAAAGSFTLAGQAATLRRTRSLTGETGAFSLAGQDATLRRARVLPAAAGSYTFSGKDATLTYTPAGGGAYTLTADAGSFTFAGAAATLTYSPAVTAEVEGFAPRRRRVLRHRELVAAAGEFRFTGHPARIEVDRSATDEALIAALLLD